MASIPYRLELRKLFVGYRDKAVLSDVSLALRPGEIVAFMGPNGCGKTTLLKAAAGTTRPLSGSVLVDGIDLARLRPAERAASCAFLAQDLRAAWPFTVKETVEQGRFPQAGWFSPLDDDDRDAVENALRTSSLEAFRDRPVTELSGGELQRVLMARAIAQKPRLYILDEPVSQLDAKYQVSAMELLRRLVRDGASAVLSLHDLNLAGMYADRIALFADGGLAALGTPQEVLREDLLFRTFGAAMVVGVHPHGGASPAVYHPLPVMPS